MQQWPFDHRTLVAHDLDWHHLVSATAVNPSPDDLPDLQALDASRLDAAWCPPLMFILNLARHFPTGLRRVGRRIDLALEKPDNYEDYFVHG